MTDGDVEATIGLGRGEAVHTARTSSSLKKATALWWNQMIVNLLH